MELSALQAELEKERQALENAVTKAQLAEEKEQQNYKLLSQFKQLQVKYLCPSKSYLIHSMFPPRWKRKNFEGFCMDLFWGSVVFMTFPDFNFLVWRPYAIVFYLSILFI